jgi:hypothetical protein
MQVLERRARVEAWQAKKRALDEEKERAQEQAAANRKAWNLEDDGSDDEAPVGTSDAVRQNDGEVDPLDEFMLDVGTKVQNDFATIDPEVAKDAHEVNEQLAKAGIKLELPMASTNDVKDEKMDTQEPVAGISTQGDEGIKVEGFAGDVSAVVELPGTAAASENSPKPSVAGGLFEGKAISPATAAASSMEDSSTITLDQVVVKREPSSGFGISMPDKVGMGVALGAAAGSKPLAISRGTVFKKELAFPAGKGLVPVKNNVTANGAAIHLPFCLLHRDLPDLHPVYCYFQFVER